MGRQLEKSWRWCDTESVLFPLTRPHRVFALLTTAGALVVAGGAGPATLSAQRGSEPSVHYVVRSDERLRTLAVEVCFDGDAPPSLGPGIARAGAALLSASTDSGALPVRGGRIDTSSLDPATCLTYRLDFERARQAARFSQRHDTDVMTSAGSFLWRDRRAAPSGGATLRFELRGGLRAVTPWPEVEGQLYLDESAFRMPSFVVLGRSQSLHFDRAGAAFEVVRMGSSEGWRLSDADVRRWLETVADGVATVQGRFPVDRLLIVMVPTYGSGMGFGMVRRGGGPSVAFQVGQRSELASLTRAWVVWHELSHLHLPPLPQRDAWLYEGIATYYQAVIPPRVGVRTPNHAWGELSAGFVRGARSRSRRPLSEEAASMLRTGAFQRVYWAGTAFALEADVALRRRGSSLDEAITHAARSWRGSARLWTSEEVCARWDRHLSAQILRPLHAAYAARRPFPQVRPLLDQLGIGGGTGQIRLEDAALSELREAVTEPRFPPPSPSPPGAVRSRTGTASDYEDGLVRREVPGAPGPSDRLNHR